MQQSNPSSSISELVANVELAFSNYPSEKISDAFITLQTVMEKVIEDLGDNTYNIPHIGKSAMSVNDKLYFNAECNESAYNTARNYLQNISIE